MNVLVMLLNSTGGSSFEQVSKPVVELLSMTLTPALGIVGTLGTVYYIFLGAKLAKAKEPRDKEKAKNDLRNATIGFVLTFVLIVVLRIGMDAISNWMSGAMGNVTP